jgi:hypothetical protein
MQKLSRRTLVAAAAVVPAGALPILKTAEGASGSDAALLVLETTIGELHDEVGRINVERVDPTRDEFENFFKLWLESSYSQAAEQAMLRFGKESGRDDAIADTDLVFEKVNRLIEAMWTMPAQTNAGRAAKLRVFFKHIALDHFKGPDSELDWDNSLARRLLLEYAGMSEDDAVRLTSEA